MLSRKKNERIFIGDDVEIVVVEIRGDKVRLGISAPKSTPVHRLEIVQAIERDRAKDDAANAIRRAAPETETPETEPITGDTAGELVREAGEANGPETPDHE